ncbi:MAG: hypothetical protein VZR95_04960 [Alphaproteobacteria bacterium]
MPTKVFTTISGLCPFGKNVMIDSAGCRSCEQYYRAGTGMFFWCNHPIEQKPAEIEQKTPKPAHKAAEIAQPAKKRGRPAKKAISKPVKTRKKKNG